MNLAFISEHASPLAALGGVDSGGQNVYVAQVARHLARRGHRVDIFTRWDNPDLPEIVDCDERIRIVHIAAGPQRAVPKEDLLPFMDDFTAQMIRFIDGQPKPYDLIHAHFFMSGLVAANLEEMRGIPFVVTFHALGKVRVQHQGNADRFPVARFAIEDRVMRAATQVIAECPQDRADMINLYDADDERITIVPCGFDPSEFHPMDKAAACRAVGLDPQRRYLLQLGRMVPRKGVANVIHGFACFLHHSHDQDIDLLIVGGESADPDPVKTPEIGRLQAIAAAEGIADRVLFVGRRDRDMLKYFYNAADVFASTPWYEPFGITPLEAMACGTPVIGSRVGGIQYTVAHGKTGLLVPPKNPPAFAAALHTLFNDEFTRERCSRRAIARVNTYFTWEKIVDKLEYVYRQCERKNQRLGDWGIKRLGIR